MARVSSPSPVLSTIYIMSKGRPECVSAQMLERIGYDGEWFIVCGDNDDTIPQYRERWGDRVLVFEWRKYAEATDLLDNFGLDSGKPSGAAPARNAIHDISARRGEARHWQFDDDMSTFYGVGPDNHKVRIEDGARLRWYLERVARFGYETGIRDVGVSGATMFLTNENKFKVDRQVFCIHNMTSGDDFARWRGRMADDFCNAIDEFRHGGVQFSFKYIGYAYTQSAKQKGGNTDIYLADGYIRKAAIVNLVGPTCCHVRIDSRGPHMQMSYPIVKILNTKWKKN